MTTTKNSQTITTEMLEGIASTVRNIERNYDPESLTVDSHANTLERLALIESFAETARRGVVVNMRAQGLTWFDIGEALGTSRQAAQQRFGQ